MRAWAFSSTAALAASRGTCASSSAFWRSLSDTKGTPVASWDWALTARLSGIAGLFWIPVKNAAVSAEIRIAPASAVPIDAPSWVPVFCTPPTSPLCSSGTAETVTLPSCEAIAPSPEPIKQQRSGDDLRAGADVEQAHQQNEAGEHQHEPRVDDPPRVRVRRELGDPGREQQQRQRHRQQPDAGLHRRQPERHRQEQRHDEERPRLYEEHEQEREHPRAHLDVAQQLGVQQRALPAPDPPALPAQEQRQNDAAAEYQPDHRREADPLGCFGLGLHDAPGAGLQDPEDDEAQTQRRQEGPEEVELDALLGRRVVDAAREQNDHRDDQHLTDEHPPPRGVGREEAADQRAQRGGDRAAAATSPYARGSLGLAEVRRHERHDRGHDQHRAQSFQARPAEHQHRQVRRQRRRQRPAGVDDAADRERALATRGSRRPCRR